jgi:hypothetical protein
MPQTTLYKSAQRQILNRRSQRGEAATTEGDRIGVSAYGRTGENDVVKPLSPERILAKMREVQCQHCRELGVGNGSRGKGD